MLKRLGHKEQSDKHGESSGLHMRANTVQSASGIMVVFVLAFGQAKAKEECKRLIKRKDELENELEQVSMYLARPDVKSFRMVDEEGFPNTDSATLYAIRSARNKQASLCRCMTIFSHPYLLLCCCFLLSVHVCLCL